MDAEKASPPDHAVMLPRDGTTIMARRGEGNRRGIKYIDVNPKVGNGKETYED